RDERKSQTLILGNGDIDSYATAISRIQQYGVDGVMVGTGIFKNPWLFNSVEQNITIEMRIALLQKHIQLYDNTWKNPGSFNVLKRFFKIYVNGFEGAAFWRDKLIHTKSCEEALEVIKQI
ncbi:MAG TPA: tRNA-dihydrouridine synthase, partial [Paludibacter sp.]